MRKLSIAYGSSCHAKRWVNQQVTFDELCERLSQTVRTPETVEEYPKLPKSERDRAKDKGGFVGGKLKGGRRKRDTVEGRSMLTQDADHAGIGFIDSYEMLCPYASCLYTTHGHTPEAPRVRVVVPLTRDVTPDEYAAISRLFAAEWGIDLMDDLSSAWRRTDAPPEPRSDDGYWVHTLKGVFEELEALGLSIPEPKPEPKKRGRKPKNPDAVKPKRPRGRPRKDANQSVGSL